MTPDIYFLLKIFFSVSHVALTNNLFYSQEIEGHFSHKESMHVTPYVTPSATPAATPGTSKRGPHHPHMSLQFTL